MSGIEAVAALGLSEDVLAWCAKHPDTLAALAGGEMVAAPKWALTELTAREYHAFRYGAALDEVRARLAPAPVSAQHAKTQEIDRDFGRDDTPPRGRFQDQAANGEGQEGK